MGLSQCLLSFVSDDKRKQQQKWQISKLLLDAQSTSTLYQGEAEVAVTVVVGVVVLYSSSDSSSGNSNSSNNG